jgi:hypothetical protein
LVSLQVETDVASHLTDLFWQTDEVFRRHFHLAYFSTYEFPDFARACCHACGKTSLASTLVKGLETAEQVSDSPEEAFCLGAMRHLKTADLAFGLLELLGARKIRMDESEREALRQWVENHSQAAEDAAFFYVKYAHSNFCARRPEWGIPVAAQVLLNADRDPFETLTPLTESKYPPTQMGVTHVFGALKEARALPYLEARLRHEEKQQRACAVQALSQIGTPAARVLIERATHDPATRVNRAAKKALQAM